MSQTHILVVGDGQLIAGVIGQYLSQIGYLVTVKNNLFGAIDWLRMPGNLTDLIVCDVAIFKENDHELMRQARADPAGIYPPVILLAADDDIAEKIAGFEAGADDYLVEPVSPVELGLRIRALLSRTQVWRPTIVSLSQ